MGTRRAFRQSACGPREGPEGSDAKRRPERQRAGVGPREQ
jgi:hypothetical protein